MNRTRTARRTFPQLLTEYADATEPTEPVEFVIPEDLTALSDEDLTTLHGQAVENFDTLYGDGQALSDADLTALGALTEGIESLSAEVSRREAAAADRADAAAALAERAHPAAEAPEVPDEQADEHTDAATPDAPADAPAEVVAEAPAVEGVVVDEPAEQIAAGATPRREIRVNLPAMRARSGAPRLPAAAEPSIRDVIRAAGDAGAFTNGTGLDWADVGRQVERRLQGFNAGQYESAARAGRHIKEQFSALTIHKQYAPELTVTSADPVHVEEVLSRAGDESRLPGGSLVAAGGWCAPSTTMYDLVEIESRDGLFSIPEIGITRGGIMHTLGPDFAAIYALAQGFHYTEAEDEAGDYDGAGGGSKPCFRIPCPDFVENRLDLDGLCITAGLLQQRGYPEMIARTVRGALVAHDHRMSGKVLTAIETGSTAVTMTAGQQGALSPLLTSIELQVEHYRSVTRISRAQSLEAVFPFWIRGAIRSDLSRRNGVNLVDVTDAQIDGWFRSRGVNPQYVYNWQDITGASTAFKAWPSTVKFLLYAAGTWVRGGSDVITLDTIYDSVLLGQNDYTALFTEEGWLVAKRLHDSRVVTVPVCADGSTAAQVEFACDGSTTPAG